MVLIKLNHPIKQTAYVRTVCYDEDKKSTLIWPTHYGVVTGWGSTTKVRFIFEIFSTSAKINCLYFIHLFIFERDFRVETVRRQSQLQTNFIKLSSDLFRNESVIKNLVLEKSEKTLFVEAVSRELLIIVLGIQVDLWW